MGTLPAPRHLFRLLAAFLALSGAMRAGVPLGAENVVPLKVGDRAPDASVRTLDGSAFDLGRAFSTRPTVLLFYRGGWCPFCNRQLSGIQKLTPEFSALGYQILAVCTDRPESLKATIDRHQLTYTLLSDRSMAASGAFRVAFRLTEGDEKRYGAHHLSLPEIPGEAPGHWLPVPSIFIIGTDGIIRYAEFNPNFTVRPPPESILAAAAQVKAAGT